MAGQEIFQDLISPVEEEMQRLHVPGVAVGLHFAGQAFNACFGVTNVENPLPVTPDTIFQTGSITKTFVASAIMRLVEQGQLDLNTPLLTWLPELRLADPNVTRAVALRHVFTHTCGWLGDYFDDAGPGDDALAQVVMRMQHLPQETPLGEIYSYNNSGYYLAGRLLEVSSGSSFETAVRELLLDPLGMDRSFFFAQDAITYRVAAGHDAVFPGQDRPPAVLRPWWLARASNPAGGLLSTVSDLLRYARFYLEGGISEKGERLLSGETIKSMRSPIFPAANGEWMGISWFLSDIDGVQVMRHGGATNGQMALLLLVPQHDFAITILTNSDRGSELYKPLSERALQIFLDLSEPEPQPIPISRGALAEYEGRYSSAAQDLLLQLPGNGLQLQVIPKGGFPTPDSPPSPAPPPTRLAFCGTDQILALDEPHRGDRGEFLRDAQGGLVWLRFSGRVHRRL